MSEKPKPKRRIRKTVTITLDPETIAAIERHREENPQLGSIGRAIEDLILRPTPNPSPNPRQAAPKPPAKASGLPK